MGCNLSGPWIKEDIHKTKKNYFEEFKRVADGWQIISEIERQKYVLKGKRTGRTAFNEYAKEGMGIEVSTRLIREEIRKDRKEM